MSGQMPAALAESAKQIAFAAQVKASGLTPGRLIARNVREMIDKRPKQEAESLPAMTWRRIDQRVKTQLVMIACDQPGDPRVLARQPWDSFSDADRAEMAATARMIRDELKHAGSLW